jgi:hypothetical protein
VSITISADDPRSIRAIEIAAHAAEWRRWCTPDGQEAFGVRSQSDPARVYVVTRATCECEDFRHALEALAQPGANPSDLHACKHILAVRLYCELVRAQEHDRPHARRGHLRVVR